MKTPKTVPQIVDAWLELDRRAAELRREEKALDVKQRRLARKLLRDVLTTDGAVVEGTTGAVRRRDVELLTTELYTKRGKPTALWLALSRHWLLDTVTELRVLTPKLRHAMAEHDTIDRAVRRKHRPTVLPVGKDDAGRRAK